MFVGVPQPHWQRFSPGSYSLIGVSRFAACLQHVPRFNWCGPAGSLEGIHRRHPPARCLSAPALALRLHGAGPGCIPGVRIAVAPPWPHRGGCDRPGPDNRGVPLTARRTGPDSAPGLNRRILSLALPALGALVAEPLFVLIDSAMVGHLGATSLAGLSLASTILTTAVGLFVFLAYSTTATTARLFGAGRRRQGLRAGVDGVWLALLLGLGAAVVLGAGASGIVAVMGAEGEVASAARAYLWASAPGLPGMLVVFAATGVLRGLLDTRTPFIVACAGAVLNTILNAFLLYGLGLGIAGSGAGTAISQTLMAVALVAPVMRAARAEGLGLRPGRAGVGGSLVEGLPLLVRTLSLRAAIVATVWAATALGPVPLAAHQVAFTLWSFAAFALDALAVAAQALIGTALGQADAEQASTGPGDAGMTGTGRTDAESGEAGRMGAEQVQQSEPGGRTAPDHPAASPGADVPGGLGAASIDAVLRRSLAWGLGTGAVIGLVLAAASPWLPWVFTSDASVRALAAPVLVIMASAMPLAGAVYLFDGVLMGAGDGRYLARAGLLTLVVYLPLAVAVGQGWVGGGLAALWLAFAWVFMGARAVTTGLRARGGAWRA